MKVDLHVHSNHSEDGSASPDRIIRKAKQKGLDGLAFLDHNTLDGYRRYDAEDFLLIPGIEITTESGHVGALGVQECVERDLPVSETLDRIRDQGGVAVAVHPYRRFSGIKKKIVLKNQWDAVEGRNGRSWARKNERAMKLASEMSLPVVGGSDSHRLKTVGKSYTLLNCVSSWEDLVREIKKGKTDVEGRSRTFHESFFYIGRTLFHWIKRGFSRV